MIKTKNKKITLLLTSLLFVFLSFSSVSNAQQWSIPQTGLPDPQNGVAGIITNLLSWLLGLFGTLAIMSFVISGIQYMLAAGDEKSMETAKRNAIYSIIGVVVGLSGYVIVKAVEAALNASSTTF